MAENRKEKSLTRTPFQIFELGFDWCTKHIHIRIFLDMDVFFISLQFVQNAATATPPPPVFTLFRNTLPNLQIFDLFNRGKRDYAPQFA